MNLNSKIYVAGHRGMVGSAIIIKLKQSGYNNIIVRTRQELDLTSQEETRRFFLQNSIDCVVLAAAKVGGIHANNNYPAEFIYENLAIQNNIIHGAYVSGVSRLLFLGSSCIYPKLAPQPMEESHLLTGYLEPTNEPYAVAKIAGIKMCESYNRQYGTRYRSVMPTNLYGHGDNFNIKNSHVIPALIRKAHDAKVSGAPSMEVWGGGDVRREFLHVDDMADASVFIMQLDDEVYTRYTSPMLSHINVGSGEDISIAELARRICGIVGYEGELIFNAEMPEGAPSKLLDVSRLAQLGWRSRISLDEGLNLTYRWFLNHQDKIRL